MASTDPWKPITLNFKYTRQDDTPIVVAMVTAANVAVPNTGRTYKMEGYPTAEPADETGQLFSLVGTAGGADGLISFNGITGGADGDFDPTGTDVIFYDIVETTSGQEHTKFEGEIELLPRRTDKGV